MAALYSPDSRFRAKPSRDKPVLEILGGATPAFLPASRKTTPAADLWRPDSWFRAQPSRQIPVPEMLGRATTPFLPPPMKTTSSTAEELGGGGRGREEELDGNNMSSSACE
uniref:Uncharacterized protein n=1 Tax=Oryza brachyantha TaxID=4533 RepID=J3MJ69_ORYBR